MHALVELGGQESPEARADYGKERQAHREQAVVESRRHGSYAWVRGVLGARQTSGTVGRRSRDALPFACGQTFDNAAAGTSWLPARASVWQHIIVTDSDAGSEGQATGKWSVLEQDADSV